MYLKRNKTVTFDPVFHEYTTTEGKFLMGVTSLLHKHGIDYTNGIPMANLAAAAAKGTEMHKLIEDYENGLPVVETEELKAYKGLILDVHECEYLISDNETVASSIDLVLEDCSLMDLKRWSELTMARRRYVQWQLSIYAYLFEKQNKSKKVPHIYLGMVKENKADKIELERIPNEKVEELIDCERKGILFVDDYKLPEVTDLIPEEQAVVVVASLKEIAEYKEAIKKAEETIAVIQDSIYKYMKDNHVTELQCEGGKFVLRSESTRVTLDSAKIKEELPDIYEKYKKTSTVKGSVQFKAQ